MTGKGVGALVIGAEVGNIKRACTVVADTIELDDEAHSARVLRVVAGGDTVDATVDSGRVWRINVEKQKIRTQDSLGVGSSLRQLLSRGSARGAEGEGGLYVMLASHCGLSFRLRYEIAPSEHRTEWTVKNLSGLPDSVRVDQVLITGCTSGDPRS